MLLKLEKANVLPEQRDQTGWYCGIELFVTSQQKKLVDAQKLVDT